MPWYQVIIRYSDDFITPEAAEGLMTPFLQKYREHIADGGLQDAEVWRILDDGADRIYYFSPTASAIAIANDIFCDFDATLCSGKPDLEGCRKLTL